VGVVDPLVMVFDTCYTSDGVCGWRMELFHEGFGLFILTQGASTTYKVQMWHVVSDIVAADEFEYKFWDPRLAKWSGFMEFGRSHADFHWDPGSSEDQLSSRFMRHSVDFIPAHYRELHIVWPCVIVLTQQSVVSLMKLLVRLQWAA
jgi:hypothetical protein